LREISNFSSERSAYSEILPEAYITTDNMLQNCEGMTEYGGKPNTETVVVYHKGDILLSNIRPYLKKLWFADRDGGCSPDVLVLHVNRDKALPEYVYYLLRRNEFFDYVMSDVKGLKMPRGKKETIERFQFVLPDKDEQQQIVSKMSAMDNDINKLYVRMQECANNKQTILDKYLK
jgi:restriction endonuclease S subunit